MQESGLDVQLLQKWWMPSELMTNFCLELIFVCVGLQKQAVVSYCVSVCCPKKPRWDKKCAIYQQFLYILNLVAVLKEDNICKCLWHPFGYKHDRSCFAWFGLCIATVEYCSDLTHPCDWASPLSVYNLSQLSFLTPGWHRKSQIL